MAFVGHQDLQLHFEESGSGPPIVLGHSFLCSGKMWREQATVLARQFRVINPDLRGHGRSGDVTSPFSLYDAAGDVVAILDHLGIDRAIWCGLSIGGMVALRAALSAPDRVSALILLDTDAGAETAYRKLKYSAMGTGTRLLGVDPFLPAITRLMFGASTHRRNPALVAEWRKEFAGARIPSTLRCLDALTRRDDLLPRLGDIKVPTLVLVGEEDRSLPPPVSRRIHERLPDSRFAIIPAAGHLSALEQPAAVNDAILQFLSTYDE